VYIIEIIYSDFNNNYVLNLYVKALTLFEKEALFFVYKFYKLTYSIKNEHCKLNKNCNIKMFCIKLKFIINIYHFLNKKIKISTRI
jgi:hypothetical protein